MFYYHHKSILFRLFDMLGWLWDRIIKCRRFIPLIIILLAAFLFIYSEPAASLFNRLPKDDSKDYRGLAQSLRTFHYEGSIPPEYKGDRPAWLKEVYRKQGTIVPPTYPLLIALAPVQPSIESDARISQVMFFISLILLYLLCLRHIGIAGATLSTLAFASLLLYKSDRQIGGFLLAPNSEMTCYAFVLAGFYALRPTAKGILFAFAALTRPEMILLAVIQAIAHKGWKYRLVMLATFIIACLPYLVFCRVNTGRWVFSDKPLFNKSMTPYFLGGFYARDWYGAFHRQVVTFPAPSSDEARQAFPRSQWAKLQAAIYFENPAHRIAHNFDIFKEQIQKYAIYLLLGLPSLLFLLFRKNPLGIDSLSLLAVSPFWLNYFYSSDRFFFSLLLACCIGFAGIPCPIKFPAGVSLPLLRRLRSWRPVPSRQVTP